MTADVLGQATPGLWPHLIVLPVLLPLLTAAVGRPAGEVNSASRLSSISLRRRYCARLRVGPCGPKSTRSMARPTVYASRRLPAMWSTTTSLPGSALIRTSPPAARRTPTRKIIKGRLRLP